MSKRKLLSATCGAVVMAAGLSAPAYATDDVFSAKYLNQYCSKAQKQIASTDLKPDTVIYAELGSAGIPFPPPGIPATGFIASSAAPYDGAENLPLTVTQHVAYSTNGDYAQTVMCKLKSAEALNFYYPDSAAAGSTCADVNAKIAKDVIRQIENENPGIVVPTIVYENVPTYAGSQWTHEAPAVTAYNSTADGLLHVVGKELFVERTNPSPFVGADKKGVDYCQTIAPEYLRNIILGAVQAPTCDAPPAYPVPVFGPPQTVDWDCQNP